MKSIRSTTAALVLVAVAASVAGPARADSYSFAFSGSGVTGALTLSFGAATDSKYPDAFEITGISGTFSDANAGLGIVNASVASLVPITHDTPEVGNLLAPHDFSRFGVASGLAHGTSLSFDNLLYPAGSPQTATDYPPHGGFLDIYGVLFTLADGKVVNLWSNGNLGSGIDYGVAVVTPAKALDYVGGVAIVPEPATAWMLGAGLFGLLVVGRRSRARAEVARPAG